MSFFENEDQLFDGFSSTPQNTTKDDSNSEEAGETRALADQPEEAPLSTEDLLRLQVSHLQKENDALQRRLHFFAFGSSYNQKEYAVCNITWQNLASHHRLKIESILEKISTTDLVAVRGPVQEPMDVEGGAVDFPREFDLAKHLGFQGPVQYYPKYSCDRSKWDVDINGNWKLWEVPTYERVTSEPIPREAVVEDPDKPKCFNCGTPGHSVADCPEPINHERVRRARQEFQSSRRPELEYRYWDNGKNPNQHSAGQLSERLRSALNMRQDDEPPYYHNMRRYGYPPGYLLPEGQSSTDEPGLAIYDNPADEKAAEFTPNPPKVRTVAYSGLFALGAHVELPPPPPSQPPRPFTSYDSSSPRNATRPPDRPPPSQGQSRPYDSRSRDYDYNDRSRGYERDPRDLGSRDSYEHGTDRTYRSDRGEYYRDRRDDDYSRSRGSSEYDRDGNGRDARRDDYDRRDTSASTERGYSSRDRGRDDRYRENYDPDSDDRGRDDRGRRDDLSRGLPDRSHRIVDLTTEPGSTRSRSSPVRNERHGPPDDLPTSAAKRIKLADPPRTNSPDPSQNRTWSPIHTAQPSSYTPTARNPTVATLAADRFFATLGNPPKPF